MKIYELIESSDIYYHGTDATFSKFSHVPSGHIGFYFTKSFDEAQKYARTHTGRVIKAVLKMNNPATPDAVEHAVNQAYGGNPRKMIREILQKQGFDSIIGPGEVVVFEPEQIHII